MKTIEEITVDEVNTWYDKIVERIVIEFKMVCYSTCVTVGLEDIDILIEDVRQLRNHIGFYKLGCVSSSSSIRKLYNNSS